MSLESSTGVTVNPVNESVSESAQKHILKENAITAGRTISYQMYLTADFNANVCCSLTLS